MVSVPVGGLNLVLVPTTAPVVISSLLPSPLVADLGTSS